MAIEILKVDIINNIEMKVNEYCLKYGSTKIWIAKQLGMSKQNLYTLFEASDIKFSILVKLSMFFECEIKDIFDYKIKSQKNNE